MMRDRTCTTRSREWPTIRRAPQAEKVPRNRRCRRATPAPRSSDQSLGIDDRLAAVRRAANARVETEIVDRVIRIVVVIVVVEELRTRRNPLLRLNPNAPARNIDLAVR